MSRPLDRSTADSEASRPDADGWLAAAPEGEGLPYYLAVLRSHAWLIVVALVVCVGAATLYLIRVDKVYQSHADLLITPVPRDNDVLIGLGLTRESTDPTRDVETVARLIKTQAVAQRVVSDLGLDLSPRRLLEKVDATPVASSNVVSVTAKANDPELAARIANSFASASVADRTDRMHAQLDVIIPQLRKQIAGLGSKEPARDALVARLRDLETLRALQDPTLHLETRAVPSNAPISPRRMLSIAAAILAGLIIGAAAALGSELFDRRLRREEQLRRYRIPIMARVPFETGRSGTEEHSPLPPESLSPTSRDSYLGVGARLSVDQSGDGAKHSVLVTGPNHGDGKTTAALNLASAISRSRRVVLAEVDSEHPVLRRLLRLSPQYGVADVVARRIPLSDALVRRESGTPGVKFLVQAMGEAPPSAVMTPASADWLIREAHVLADWLIVDAAPLATVPDALPLAKQVDDVLLVVRLGNTRLKMLEELAELLAQQSIRPAGFVLVGARQATARMRSWLERLTARAQSERTRRPARRARAARGFVTANLAHVRAQIAPRISARQVGSISSAFQAGKRRSAAMFKRARSLLQQSRPPQTEPPSRASKRELPRQHQGRGEGDETKRRTQERRSD